LRVLRHKWTPRLVEVSVLVGEVQRPPAFVC
jgi:hypothetical protein